LQKPPSNARRLEEPERVEYKITACIEKVFRLDQQVTFPFRGLCQRDLPYLNGGRNETSIGLCNGARSQAAFHCASHLDFDLSLSSVLDGPLKPNGIVSFELARTPERASAIMAGWTRLRSCMPRLAWSDYLFMPSYASRLRWRFAAAALFDAVEILLVGTLVHRVNLTCRKSPFWCASFKSVDSVRDWIRFIGSLLPKSAQDEK